MFRETDDFGVDISPDDQYVFVQKKPEPTEKGRVLIAPADIQLVSQWIDEATKEIHRRAQQKK